MKATLFFWSPAEEFLALLNGRSPAIAGKVPNLLALKGLFFGDNGRHSVATL